MVKVFQLSKTRVEFIKLKPVIKSMNIKAILGNIDYAHTSEKSTEVKINWSNLYYSCSWQVYHLAVGFEHRGKTCITICKNLYYRNYKNLYYSCSEENNFFLASF